MLSPNDVPGLLATGASSRADDNSASKFQAGNTVVAKNINIKGHNRIPAYIKGKQGVIDRDHGVFSLPDAAVAGTGEKPQHVYSVCFRARELWGDNANENDVVYIDLFDDYLEQA